MKQKKQLNDLEYSGYYWYGIPTHLQGIFELRLQGKLSAHDNTDPWPIQTIQEVAESYFKRSKFSSHLPHLPILGFEEEDEEEEESDYDYDYESDSDSDYERERRKRRKQKAVRRKKKKARGLAQHNPTQVISEEPSRNIVSPPEEKGLEGLIHCLNMMSLEDPHYGALYYQAVSRDPSGLVVQCITRKPKQVVASMQSSRDPPPHQYPTTPERQAYPRGMLPRQPGMQLPSKCFGCFEIGHSLRDCPKMAQLLNQGVVTLDSQTFKYRFPNGQPILQQQDECLAETISRMRPVQRTVQFATIGKAVEQHYNKASGKSYLQASYSESEEEQDEMFGYETDSDNDEEDKYEEGHWKWRLQH